MKDSPKLANRQPYFSIIIPIYKVEDYLEKCLSSIKEQTFGDYECILINQSSGRCEKICRNYVLENSSRFAYFFQTHPDVSEARMKGMSMAKGKYCVFVDGDDWLENGALEKIAECLKQSNASVVIFDYYRNYGDGSQEAVRIMRRDSGEISQESALNLLLSNKIESYCWNKAFSSSLINHVEFPKGVAYEDMFFSERLLFANDKNVFYLHDPLYHYFQRPYSITKTFDEKNTNDFLLALKERADFASSCHGVNMSDVMNYVAGFSVAVRARGKTTKFGESCMVSIRKQWNLFCAKKSNKMRIGLFLATYFPLVLKIRNKLNRHTK